MNEELYKNHTAREEHRWDSEYVEVNNIRTFIGLTCECGAFISSDKLASIVNSYQGNRVIPSFVLRHVEKGIRV